MIKRLLFTFGLLIAVYTLKAQTLKINEGSLAELDNKNSTFQILSTKQDRLLMLERYIEKKSYNFYLHLYNPHNSYSLVKRVPIDYSELKGGVKVVETLEVVNGEIYVVISALDKKRKKRIYYAQSYDLNLNIKNQWQSLLEVDLGTKEKDLLFSESSFISFSAEDSLFYITNNIIQDDEGQDIRHFYDFNFKKIEGSIVKEEKSIDALLPVTDGLDKYMNDLAYFNGKNGIGVYAFLMGEEKEASHTSDQNIYYSFIDEKTKEVIKGGKITTLPKDVYLELIVGHFDTTHDILTLSGICRKGDKGEITNLLFLKYDVKDERVLAENYNTLSPEVKSVIDALSKDSKGLIKRLLLKTTRLANDEGYIIKGSSGTGASKGFFDSFFEVDWYVTSNDLFYISLSTDGLTLTQSAIPNLIHWSLPAPFFYTRTNILGRRYLEEYILQSNSDTSYLVFLDNCSDYSKGQYKGKDRELTEKNKQCLAVLKIPHNGSKAKREVFIDDIAATYGINLFPQCLIKIADKEYIWYGYKDGKGKVLTFTLD